MQSPWRGLPKLLRANSFHLLRPKDSFREQPCQQNARDPGFCVPGGLPARSFACFVCRSSRHFLTIQLYRIFPNQFVSRHRRKAIRARCNMTQRLLSEMFNVRQISLLSSSSISRKQKAALMFPGNLPAHSWKTFQKASLSRLAPGSGHSFGPSS